MKKTALPLVLFALLALAACGGDDAQLNKLSGVWGVDVEASLAMDENMKDMGPEEKELTVEMAKVFLSAMSLEIDVANKKITANIGSSSEEADFTVESVKGGNIVLKVDGDTHDIEFKGDNTIVFGLTPDSRLVLVRKP